jgi:hypothetical protein
MKDIKYNWINIGVKVAIFLVTQPIKWFYHFMMYSENKW